MYVHLHCKLKIILPLAIDKLRQLRVVIKSYQKKKKKKIWEIFAQNTHKYKLIRSNFKSSFRIASQAT